MRRRSLVLLGALIFSSCSQLHTGRTYLSEMEHEDGRFFNPENDFPVVAGDMGEVGMSESDRRQRTPASIHDAHSRKFSRSLQEELRELESNQSEESQALYEDHKLHLATTSEKIYFLKLPPSERREYLEARGFINSVETKAVGQIRFGLRKNEVSLGMSKSDVVESLGRPLRVDIAGNPTFENERWAYKVNGNTKYIYFESGEVQGWE